MAIEKKWETIPPRSFTADGTVDGIVTVNTTIGFRVKQKVLLKQGPVPTGEPFIINRVLSETQLRVGPIGRSIAECADISSYTVASGATIEVREQPHNPIEQKEHERAVYEEEPIVAKRVFLIDTFGNPAAYVKDSEGTYRLAVDANVSIDTANINVDLDANTGDNVAISRHQNPFTALVDVDVAKAGLDTANYTEILSLTSSSDDLRLSVIKIKADTLGVFRVKIDGFIKDYFMTSPMERNVKFIFKEDLDLLNTKELKVEFLPERLRINNYNFFMRVEGYLQ